MDNNPAMNDRAVIKKRKKNLFNLDIMHKGIEEVDFPENSMAGLVSVHALYTFPDPAGALRHMYRWLKPGGKGILVDPGRIVNVWNWQLAIGWRLFWKFGISRTLKIFRDAKPVSRQNRHIRDMQRKGELWTHSPEEFQQAVAQAGFIILDARTCFRGLSDRVVVTKV